MRIKSQRAFLFVVFTCLFLVTQQVMGIEPTYSAWKADILPLNYTCNHRNNTKLFKWTTKRLYFISLFIVNTQYPVRRFRITRKVQLSAAAFLP